MMLFHATRGHVGHKKTLEDGQYVAINAYLYGSNFAESIFMNHIHRYTVRTAAISNYYNSIYKSLD